MLWIIGIGSIINHICFAMLQAGIPGMAVHLPGSRAYDSAGICLLLVRTPVTQKQMRPFNWTHFFFALF